jgi:hypothetical protein
MDRIDPLEAMERIDPLEAIERIDPVDPIEPRDAAEAAEPNESTEPADAADRTDATERHDSTDHREPRDSTDRSTGWTVALFRRPRPRGSFCRTDRSDLSTQLWPSEVPRCRSFARCAPEPSSRWSPGRSSC